jgi:hypothetical protein
MCKYASFVLTKDQIFWSKKSESHEEIIRENSLCECDSSRIRINIVRVEISPVKVWGDLSRWVYKVDQDNVPEWYDAKECEARTRKALAKKVDKQLLSAFRDLDKLLAEIAKVKYFQPAGSPVKSWKIFYGKTWAAARDAARDAARAAAGDAAGKAARDAAWKAAGDAARAAAGAAARAAAGAAAWNAARDAAWNAAWAAAWAAALISRIIICKGLPLDAKHIRHAKARWNVWKRGYGLYCDINGVLYVYAKEK